MSNDPPADPSALDVARAREVPAFCIVDEDLRMAFSSGAEPFGTARTLPAEMARAVGRLRGGADSRPPAIVVLSATHVLRVQRLEGRDGLPHYAIFMERFAARNSVRKAAERYALTARETQVLEGLLRGESSDGIALALGIGITTVHEHVRKIGRKTNATKRSAIVATVFGLR